LMMMGGHLVINGTVKDDVRFMGRSLLVTANGRIADDLVFTGYSLETQAGSLIEGNVAFSGYKALLAGAVFKDIYAAGNGFSLQGHVGGLVQVVVKDPADEPLLAGLFDLIPPRAPSPTVAWGLAVDEGARIDGSLTYTTTTEALIAPGAAVSSVTFDRLVIPEEELAARRWSWLLRHLRRLSVLTVIGLVMVGVAPAWTQEIGALARARPLGSAGWGVAAFLLMGLIFIFVEAMTISVVLALGLISFASLVQTGITLLVILSLLSLLLFLFLLVAGTAVSAIGYCGGQFILRRVRPVWAERQGLSLLVGVLVLAFLGAIPALGQLLYGAVTLVGLGAIFLWGRDNF
jgi:hypothetical protein